MHGKYHEFSLDPLLKFLSSCSVVIVLFCLFSLPANAISPLMQSTGTPPVAIVPPAILWNQGNDISDENISSQDFIDGGGSFDVYDSRAADDFLVPEDFVWTVRTVITYGTFDDVAPNLVQSLDVVFFNDNGGRPGDEITECDNKNIQPRDINDPSFIIDLPNPCIFKPGKYWVSVRANMLFLPNGQWFWFESTVQTLSPFVWENPGDGFGSGCVMFFPAKARCGADFPDLAFQLAGEELPVIRPIPALGEWGMITVFAMLALAGIIALSMRRKREIEAR